ncbi:MAG: FAD-dependent oxidoreductase [Dehalococcoidales bacterium]|nr:FAD-dependent oxidoreductase [Dehalococcoidales bacterium]
MPETAAVNYYTKSKKLKIPAFIHVEKCWPAVDKLSPCEAACPLQMDVPNYIIAIAQGDARKALDIIRQTNPLPSVCGRVCHHPCETECNRRAVDSAVAIEALKQYAADYGRRELPQAITPSKPAKVAIVGSGPAGLTAAHDLVIKGYAVSIFEAAPVAGGILTSAIPEFILSKEAVQRDIDYIKALGVQIHTNIAIGKKVTLQDLRRRGFSAILVAIGHQKSAGLKITGAPRNGVFYALDYLKEAKNGFSKPLKGKVWIIGGGAVAMDCARTAIRQGAAEVHIACLESRENMPAFAWEIEAAEREGVKVHPALAPQELTSKNGTRVNGIKFQRVSSTSLDSAGRVKWTLLTGAGGEFSIDTDTVIIAVGQTLDQDAAPSELTFNPRGLINVDALTGETGLAGVFAAGDAAGTGRTVTGAMAAGRRAALSIDQYLSGQPVVPVKENRGVITIKPEQVPSYFVRRERWEMPRLSPRQAVKTNREVDLGYAKWQAMEEANRCLNCRMCANCVFERGQLCYDTAMRLL